VFKARPYGLPGTGNGFDDDDDDDDDECGMVNCSMGVGFV
jgi:hypothetical protein